MKKIGFLAVLFSFLPGLLPAAEVKDTFGVAGGVTSFNQLFSNASGSVETDTTQTIGIYSGVFGEMPLTGSLVFSPGIFLAQKGAENTTTKIRANYLETSAQLKWFFVNGSDFRFYLGAGLGFGILLSAERQISTGSTVDSFVDFTKNELSGQGGLGFEFSISQSTALQLGGAYVRGLTSHTGNNLLSGNWEGLYGFAALRFKEVREDNSPEKRARDYIRYKVQNFRDGERETNPKEEGFTEDEASLEKKNVPEFKPQENLEGSLFEDFTEENREPASQAKAPQRLAPKQMSEEPLLSHENDVWEQDQETPTSLDEDSSWSW